MTSRPWMPLYIPDYLADTSHMSTVEHGAYLLLIMHYWQHGGLPDDDRKLARVARLTADEWGEIRDTIAEHFCDGWRHKRIDAELARAADVMNKRRAAGKAGAEARYGKRVANAKQVPSQTQSQTHRQPQPQPHEGKELPNGSSKRQRGCRIPDDWMPDIDAAVALGLPYDAAVGEAEQFRDYWQSVAGQKGVKLDWPKTWMTWVRREVKRRKERHDRFGSPQTTRRPESGTDAMGRALARIVAQRRKERGEGDGYPGEPFTDGRPAERDDGGGQIIDLAAIGAPGYRG